MIDYAHRPVSRVIDWLAGGLAALLLLVPTAIYGIFVVAEAGRDLDASLHFQARVVEQFIQHHPDNWQSNAERLQAAFEPFALPGESYRLVAGDGRTVFEVGAVPKWDFRVRRKPVHSFGEPVAELESGASLRQPMYGGLALLVVCALMAWLVWGPVRRLPLDALDRAERRLRDHHLHLEDIVNARTADLVLARDAAELASRAKTEFLSSMSHELRTPLNAILGFSQLLEMEEGLTPIQAEHLAEIRLAGNHLLELIDEVLDLGRIESGNLVMRISSIQLDPLLDECFRLVMSDAVRLELDLRRDPGVCAGVRVVADSLRLKQVLVNLLSNAVKYNRPGGSVTLVCSLTAEGWLRLAVNDTGMGIPFSRQAELFKAFSRLGRESGNIVGTGIGLSISKRLVEMMGGRIGFSSRPGEGSSFWVEFSGFDLAPGVEPPALAAERAS